MAMAAKDVFGVGEGVDSSSMEGEAWELLQNSVVTLSNAIGYRDGPIGTCSVASDTLKDEVVIREFFPSAIVFLLKGEVDIVQNFLYLCALSQNMDKLVNRGSAEKGLLPASFKVMESSGRNWLDRNFGESDSGHAPPIDSGFWWIIILRAYGKLTGDYSLEGDAHFQQCIKSILEPCLEEGLDLFPSLLVTIGSCVRDHRLGIYSHPLEIQALFCASLRSALEMLKVTDVNKGIRDRIRSRLTSLLLHIRSDYWLDAENINKMYRGKAKGYLDFEIDEVPSWVVNWIPDNGGYFCGDLQPSQMDFRFCTLGNLFSAICSLATCNQSRHMLSLIDNKWSDLMEDMPLKICYPTLKTEDCSIMGGNAINIRPWSDRNGGSWPNLLVMFTLACVKLDGEEASVKFMALAHKAIGIAEKKLSSDGWPEYYDSYNGKLVGKKANLFQTSTIAGYLAAKLLLKDPEKALKLTWKDDTATPTKEVQRTSSNTGASSILRESSTQGIKASASAAVLSTVDHQFQEYNSSDAASGLPGTVSFPFTQSLPKHLASSICRQAPGPFSPSSDAAPSCSPDPSAKLWKSGSTTPSSPTILESSLRSSSRSAVSCTPLSSSFPLCTGANPVAQFASASPSNDQMSKTTHCQAHLSWVETH